MSFDRDDNQKNVYGINGKNAKAVRSFNSILASDWTSFDVTYPNTTTEEYSFKDGATVIKTVTIVYTDTSKAYLSSVTRG